MMSAINPEAAMPTTTQSFEQSDRNPPIVNWGGADAEGGLTATPASSESRITPAGPAVSPDAGLKNYDTRDSADSVEDESEQEG